jgi:hypothetical protein
MATLPQVSCPRCRAAADYQVTVEIAEPPVGKIDIGYCGACARLFEYVREIATAYESTAWLPVCRHCKQPVTVVAVTHMGPVVDDDHDRNDTQVDYVCRDHPAERWQHRRADDTWHRSS